MSGRHLRPALFPIVACLAMGLALTRGALAAPAEAGTIAVEAMHIESELMAYGAARAAVANIAEAVRYHVDVKVDPDNSELPVRVVTRPIGTDLIVLRETERQLASLKSRYEALGCQAQLGIAGDLPAAGEYFGFLTKVMGLWQSDETYKSKMVTLDPEAITALMIAALVEKRLKPSAPAIHAGDGVSSLLTALDEVQRAKALADACQYDPKSKEGKQLAAVHATFAALLAGLEKVDEEKRSLMTRLLLVEALTGSKDHWILFVKPVAGGGTAKGRTNIFTGPRLSHSGGSILAYVLYEPGGAISDADVVGRYEGFVRHRTRTVSGKDVFHDLLPGHP